MLELGQLLKVLKVRWTAKKPEPGLCVYVLLWAGRGRASVGRCRDWAAPQGVEDAPPSVLVVVLMCVRVVCGYTAETAETNAPRPIQTHTHSIHLHTSQNHQTHNSTAWACQTRTSAGWRSWPPARRARRAARGTRRRCVFSVPMDELLCAGIVSIAFFFKMCGCGGWPRVRRARRRCVRYGGLSWCGWW